jgi:3-hydroxybutyryl-CoA dehydrogenase
MRPLVIVSGDHPWQELLEGSCDLIPYEDLNTVGDSWKQQVKTASTVFDFTNLDHREKYQLLEEISQGTTKEIYTEAYCQWGDELLKLFPKVKGLFNTIITGPNPNYEYYVRDEASEKTLLGFFQSYEYTGFRTTSAGIALVFPRTMAVVINEAYYALEDGIAGRDNIDLAMKVGTRYPYGPIEWCEKIGAVNVIRVLDCLIRATGEARYQVAPLLRLAALEPPQLPIPLPELT